MVAITRHTNHTMLKLKVCEISQNACVVGESF